MRPIPAEPPPIFRRGPSPLARVTFLGLASIVLLFADARFRYLEDVRHAAGAILFPLQRLVRVPGEALDSVAAYFASKRDLERENEEKTSAVHFVRFELSDDMAAALRRGAALSVGVDHENYRAEANPLPDAVRAALVADLA